MKLYNASKRNKSNTNQNINWYVLSISISMQYIFHFIYEVKDENIDKLQQ